MWGSYTLEWLDVLISETLNPKKKDIASFKDEQVKSSIDRLEEEKEKCLSTIKNGVFGMIKESQIKLFLKQYHSALVFLLDKALENHNSLTQNHVNLIHLSNEIISCLDELLSYIEVRFFNYLCLDDRVSATYLTLSREEVSLKVELLNQGLFKKTKDKQLNTIILNYIHSFLNPNKNRISFTFQQVLYIKELVLQLANINEENPEQGIYSSVNKRLIYINFNHPEYVNHFIKQISEQMISKETTAEKADFLLWNSKMFNQLNHRIGIAFNPILGSLNERINNWFSQELLYLENKLKAPDISNESDKRKVTSPPKKIKSKVTCDLSTDQTGLIIRAADELRVLVAKSMSEVFKTIVPHLSTPYKEDLSYDGMRSKSYVAEERDKQIAIETLEKIIKKIKGY